MYQILMLTDNLCAVFVAIVIIIAGITGKRSHISKEKKYMESLENTRRIEREYQQHLIEKYFQNTFR